LDNDAARQLVYNVPASASENTPVRSCSRFCYLFERALNPSVSLKLTQPIAGTDQFAHRVALEIVRKQPRVMM
jgi:hypothetical protein